MAVKSVPCETIDITVWGLSVILPPVSLSCLLGLGRVHGGVNRSVWLRLRGGIKHMHRRTAVCAYTCTHLGLIPDWDSRSGEVFLIKPSFLRSLLVPPAALRSRAVIHNGLTRISGFGQTADLIRRDSERQTTQTHSWPPFSPQRSHTHM